MRLTSTVFVASVAKSVFSPDVWNYALGYLNSFFKICDQSSMNASETGDDQKEEYGDNTRLFIRVVQKIIFFSKSSYYPLKLLGWS